MHGIDQTPLALHLSELAQQELPEPTGLLDLSEHRLGQGLAQPVAAAPSTTTELAPHGGQPGMTSASAPQSVNVTMTLA